MFPLCGFSVSGLIFHLSISSNGIVGILMVSEAIIQVEEKIIPKAHGFLHPTKLKLSNEEVINTYQGYPSHPT